MNVRLVFQLKSIKAKTFLNKNRFCNIFYSLLDRNTPCFNKATIYFRKYINLITTNFKGVGQKELTLKMYNLFA